MSEAMAILEQCGAILRGGHFVYTSGRHGSAYVNKDAVYPHTLAVEDLCSHVAFEFRHHGVEAVVGPAIGGTILSQWMARCLMYETRSIREVLALYAEKSPVGTFALRRGYDRLVAGRRVLVVEDVVTTGGSVRGVVEAVKAAGGIVAGVACLVNRGGVTAEQVGSPGPLVSLVDLPLESWDAGECPLCRAGVPVDVEVGKGREFVEVMGR